MLIDNHNRVINYVRLAVTDRCNLRCYYCMPESGIDFKKRSQLLSYEEIFRIMNILCSQGINKIRITGGEPFIRKDIMALIRGLSEMDGLDKIAITTNGILTGKYLKELIDMGIRSINLSLDTLDAQRFYTMTRRDDFDKVWKFYNEALAADIDLKINAVVISDQNIDDIHPLVALTEKKNVSVRFIEEMPFNGKSHEVGQHEWNYIKILDHIQSKYGALEKLKDPAGSTSLNYKVTGFQGSIGVIPAFSRTFCGSCNRIRITPEGLLKTCLYDQGVFNIRDIMRAGATDEEVLVSIKEALGHRAKDGFEAERNRNQQIFESMSSIGG